jgi:hypothetical protein
MSTNYPVNPRVRAFGKARIDIAQRAHSREDWDKLWKRPIHPFPFAWGDCWKQCVEYKVDDFAAEVGFFIDILGLPVNAFDPGYAMFTSPHGDFFFAVVPAPEDGESTPPDALRLQFMVTDILATTTELESRGIEFEQPPQPCQPGSSLYIGYFRTPHGICVDLWGMVKTVKSATIIAEQEEEDEDDLLDELEDEEDEDEEFFPGLADDKDDEENEKSVEEVKPRPISRVPLPPVDEEDDDLDDLDDLEDIDDDDDVEYVDVDTP